MRCGYIAFCIIKTDSPQLRRRLRVRWRRHSVRADMLESLCTNTLQLSPCVFEVCGGILELRLRVLRTMVLLAVLSLQLAHSGQHLRFGFLDTIVLSHIGEDVVKHDVAEEVSCEDERSAMLSKAAHSQNEGLLYVTTRSHDPAAFLL